MACVCWMLWLPEMMGGTVPDGKRDCPTVVGALVCVPIPVTCCRTTGSIDGTRDPGSPGMISGACAGRMPTVAALPLGRARGRGAVER